MTAYVTVTGTATYNRAKYKPHDKHLVRIAKNTHNAAATTIPDGQYVNMITIPANSLVLGVWGMIAADSNLADAELDIGLGDGSQYGAKVETDGTAGTVASAECLDNVTWCKAANRVTIGASNSADVNAGSYTVVAAWIELDSLAASA